MAKNHARASVARGAIAASNRMGAANGRAEQGVRRSRTGMQVGRAPDERSDLREQADFGN